MLDARGAKTRGALKLKKILVPMLDARGAAIRHIFKLVSAMQLVCHLKSLTVQFFNQYASQKLSFNCTVF